MRAAMTIGSGVVEKKSKETGNEERSLTDENLPSCRPDDRAQVFRDIGHRDITACRIIILIVLIPSCSCSQKASVSLVEAI
jgi:hypothetical protein